MRRGARAIHVTLALVLALVLGGCRSVTELVVRVGSDVAAGDAFDAPGGGGGATGRLGAIAFGLEDLGFGTPIEPLDQPGFSRCVPLQAGDCFPIELGVVAAGDWDGRDFGVEVRGLGSCAAPSAPPYLVTRALARFVDGQLALLPLQLGEDGVCVDPSAADGGCAPTPTQPPIAEYAPAACR